MPHSVCLSQLAVTCMVNHTSWVFLERDCMTPEEWYRNTIGKEFDTDNYPRNNPYQCWDYFDVFCRDIKFNGSRYCSITGFVGDLWKLRYKYGYYTEFDFILPDKIKEGDWLFWDKHVAFYYHGLEVGQNQNGKRYVSSMALNRNGLLGAMRWKHWDRSENGVAEKYSRAVAGTYITKTAVNIRRGGSTDYSVIACIPKGSTVDCYGYFHLEGNEVWLYVVAQTKTGTYTGFMCSDYLEKR